MSWKLAIGMGVAWLLAVVAFVALRPQQELDIESLPPNTLKLIERPPSPAPDQSASARPPPMRAEPEQPPAAPPPPLAAIEPAHRGIDTQSPVDAALKALTHGAFAFEAPDTLALGKIETVRALLSVQKSPAEVAQLLQGHFPVQGATVGVSPVMTATLTGLDFEISPSGPQTQAVSDTSDTAWSWQVKPMSAGAQTLHLTLNAIIQVQGENVPRIVTELSRAIDVTVPPPTLLERFEKATSVLKDLDWLWTTLLVPAGVWLVARMRKKA